VKGIWLASAIAVAVSCSSTEPAVENPGASGAAANAGAGGANPGSGGFAASGGSSGSGGLDAAPALASCADAGVAAGFHVSPNGAPSGNGTADGPWDLATALGQPSTVQPGATIWLHGGVYKGAFTSALTGADENPITVRGYPGDRAVLDGVDTPSAQVLTINGAYSVFRDFEVTSSFATRVVASTGSNPADARGSGVGMYAKGVKLINLVIHDTGVGVGNWSPASDGEVYGCIIFYNGWDAPDRGHGHGIYAQNQTGKKLLTDNVIFRQFSYGIHGYTEGGTIDNFVVEGNIVFHNGEMSKTSGFATDILVGGLKVAASPTLRENFTYSPPGEGSNNVGYSAGCTDPSIVDNTFVASPALEIVACTGATTITGNSFVGPVSGFTATDFPDNSYWIARTKSWNVVVRPNRYDPSRVHIAAYNWDNWDSLPVNVSGVLGVGEAYDLYDVQNLFGAPVASGVFAGGAFDLPMTSTAVTAPTGNVPITVQHTPKTFGAFLLRKRCQ
jgi:hypothetical protein